MIGSWQKLEDCLTLLRMSSSFKSNVREFAPPARSLRAQIANQLRTLISEGTFPPGERLVERELCERLGVSRPSVREAISQLEVEGLIDVSPNRSVAVRMLDTAEVLEIWEVRFALECLIARRLALYGLHEDYERLDLAIRSLRSALIAQDKVEIRLAKNAFFDSFAAGSHNRTLMTHFHQLTVRLSFLWSSSLMVPGRPEESISEKFALLAAVRARNPDASQAAIVLQNDNAKAIALYGLRAFEEFRRAASGEPRSLPEGHYLE